MTVHNRSSAHRQLPLLKNGQTQSALHHVNLPPYKRCHECIEIYATCCGELGRFTQAKEALESIVRGEGTARTGSFLFNETFVFPNHKTMIGCSSTRQVFNCSDMATLFTRSGNMAMRTNQSDVATSSLKEALKLNPFIWEAFEDLCAVGL